MKTWHKTGCVLCAQNCGLEVLVDEDRIIRVRPDKDNPRSQGYVCRKGLNIPYHQYPKDRLTVPLKRMGDGFKEITWNQAVDEILEASQIFTLLADRLGLIPDIPDYIQKAAEGDRLTFGMHLMEWAGKTPNVQSRMPFVLAKTLGSVWNSAALAASWGMLMTAPKAFRKNAARAGFQTGLDQGDRVFQALLDTPQGLWVGKADIADNWAAIRTPSGKIEIFIPELEEQAKNLNAISEAEGLKMPPDFPFILNAGRHTDTNMNTLMRNPEWNKGKRACTVAINPEDAGRLGLTDGQSVRVITEAGNAVGELQVSPQIRSGMVLIPHGFGLIYDEAVYGININQLTKNTHRDPLGTPIHRFVPCRIESA